MQPLPLPLYYYHKGRKTYSEDWVRVIKNSIATIAPHYTMKRQLDDYYEKFYCKQAERRARLEANGNRLALDLAAWKEAVAERWDAINVVVKDDSALLDVETGKQGKLTYVIDEQGLNDAIGLELVTIKNNPNGEQTIHTVIPFTVEKHEGNLYTFVCEFDPNEAGAYKTGVRMFPKNDQLPHRQDFSYVKWL